MRTITNNDFFNRPKEEYHRSLNVISAANRNMSVYLGVMTGTDPKIAENWLANKIEPIDPVVKILARNQNGDRVKKETTFTRHLQDAATKGRIVSPNLIVYENPAVKESITARYIIKKGAQRSVEKEMGMQADVDGDETKANFHESNQTTIKRYLNSISGAHASPYTPLYNNTAHPVLTSITRCSTSTSNSHAERLLAGSRVYATAKLAIQDLCASVALADKALVEAVMEKYNLRAPTCEELFQHVVRSYRLYARFQDGEERIRKFVFKMEPWQRAVGMFTYDLYGLKEINPEFTRNFITELSTPATEIAEDWKDWNKGVNSYMKDHVAFLMAERLDGRQVKDVKDDDSVMAYFGSTAKKNELLLDSLRDFISAFYLTDHTVLSVWDVKPMLRRIVPLSDTDSTFFICADWVEWITGSLKYTYQAIAVSATIAYLDAASLRHLLALMSKQIGVPDEHLFRIAMKTEFFLPVIGVTTIAKHYFSQQAAREGVLYPNPKMDAKGVNLRNSRINEKVVKSCTKYMEDIIEVVKRQRLLSPTELLKLPVSWANEIADSARSGETTYMLSANVKSQAAYKHAEANATYQQHSLWEEVFAPEYGSSGKPPYSAFKVPVNLSKKDELEQFMGELSPRQKTAIKRWMEAYGKTGFTNFLVPKAVLMSGYVPKELVPFINVDKIEVETMRSFILALEVCDMSFDTHKDTMLLSQIYPRKKSLSLYTREELWSNNTPIIEGIRN